MTGSVFTKPYTSAHNIVSLLYAVVFLLPFTHLFYVPLVIALLLALWRVREHGKQELRIGSLRQAGAAFLLCSFLSVINSPDKLFSLFNWCFLPLMYAVLYILIVTYADSRDIRKNLMLSFFAGDGIWRMAVYTYYRYGYGYGGSRLGGRLPVPHAVPPVLFHSGKSEPVCYVSAYDDQLQRSLLPV